MEIREEVLNGAAWLDKVKPGWYKWVDLKRLRLSDCHQCVLGQLYGPIAELRAPGVSGFHYALDHDVVPQREASPLGFTLRLGQDGTAWELLTAEWKFVIKERRNADLAERKERELCLSV